ncbi:MAG: response regulator [Lachnospiraceae bacterium]|nr:response regulator [Lachnospiraceae bacterium]
MKNKGKNELHELARLILLIMMALFTTVLIVLNRMLKWEIWMIPVLITCTLICWLIHISGRMAYRTQLYISGIVLVFMMFYYTVNVPTVFDSTGLIVLVLVLFAFCGEKLLIMIGLAAGYSGMIIHLILKSESSGLDLQRSNIIRVVWQFILILLATDFVNRAADAWRKTINNFQEKIDEVTEENNRANNFLANVSHEIRTPVNAVMGLSSVLKKESLPGPVMDNVTAISEAGHRVAEQIGDILDYTEIDMDKLSVTKESYMIASLVNDLLVQLSFTNDYGLDLVVDMEAGIPSELIGDSSKIKKILWHLIGNGYKYTDKGGVYVHIYPVEREYGINLILEVKDTGIGMDDDEIDHIYDKFYQSDSNNVRVVGGLGLGIPIVNGFTKAMGGVIVIESEPGEGTTVRVSIPQTVTDSAPCISVRDKENCVVAGFLGFMTTGHPKIREYYMEMIAHLVSGLGVSFHRVESREHLEKLVEETKITHLFVGTGEYLENRNYIESLAEKMNVAVVADRGFDVETDQKIAILAKPFYGTQVANFLNHSFEDSTESGEEVMTCPGIKTLVVDDEPMNLWVAKGIFETYGMVVSTADSGQEAIDMCEIADFDIIFMDHMMPGMDGVEAMKRLRANAQKKNKELCIVALTANAISSAKEMFLSEGFDGFIPKPVEITELERVLKRVLPKSAIQFERKADNNLPASDQKEEKKQESDAFEILERIGVDTMQGLSYCQKDKNFYCQLLLEYAKNSEEKIKNLQNYYANNDWEDYSIRTHAVKSTSKMIGAIGLYDTARFLEEASKNKDIDEINRKHDEFMIRYTKLMNIINELFAKDADSKNEEDDDILEFEPADSIKGGEDNE